ncbi:MAG TPA: RagB/SusD family nutrient uptake outer membrane protein [Rhodothermales bacterium]|nr:RagB/SusD family nutrient uptake outer membrane protein [Rhodothermales bacterium]HRR10187.1 RagB/SusD family nutrient uptake outer membrane protein [Rhodothermales bacterium]
MKNFKNWLMAGVLALGLSACDQMLDVNPVLSIDDKTALLTADDVRVTLTGAFDGLSSGVFYGGAVQYTGELLGDDREVVFGGTYTTLDEFYRKTITTSNVDVRDIWAQGYATINRANHVLAALDKVSGADKAYFEGQALFIRGVVYFELARLFGKAWGDGDNNTNLAVPLVLTPTLAVTEADYKPRNTVAAVYAQVLEDLGKAVTLLPTDVEDGVVTKDAARAMLSRVYLMQGNYATARDVANSVISGGNYGLTPSFEEAFADDTASPEIIFSIIVSEQDGVNNMNTFYASTDNQGRGDIRVQTKHLALYEAADQRGRFFETVNSRVFTLKFADQYGDVPIVRLAEMYLTRAECNQRLGTTTGAAPKDDVNRIRQRAGLSGLVAVTLNDILKERKLELAFEGHQVHDIKRTKGVVGATPFSANNLVLPIPQREMDTNNKLVQNPGYN